MVLKNFNINKSVLSSPNEYYKNKFSIDDK